MGDSLFSLLNNFTHSENLNTALETFKWGMGGVGLKDRLLQAKVKGFKKQSCMWAVGGRGGGRGGQSVA